MSEVVDDLGGDGLVALLDQPVAGLQLDHPVVADHAGARPAPGSCGGRRGRRAPRSAGSAWPRPRTGASGSSRARRWPPQARYQLSAAVRAPSLAEHAEVVLDLVGRAELPGGDEPGKSSAPITASASVAIGEEQLEHPAVQLLVGIGPDGLGEGPVVRDRQAHEAGDASRCRAPARPTRRSAPQSWATRWKRSKPAARGDLEDVAGQLLVAVVGSTSVGRAPGL